MLRVQQYVTVSTVARLLEQAKPAGPPSGAAMGTPQLVQLLVTNSRSNSRELSRRCRTLVRSGGRRGGHVSRMAQRQTCSRLQSGKRCPTVIDLSMCRGKTRLAGCSAAGARVLGTVPLRAWRVSGPYGSTTATAAAGRSRRIWTSNSCSTSTSCASTARSTGRIQQSVSCIWHDCVGSGHAQGSRRDHGYATSGVQRRQRSHRRAGVRSNRRLGWA